MSKKKKNQKGKQLSHLEGAIKQSEKNYEELAREHEETLKELQKVRECKQIEKQLKNEAYAYLLAEGLLDKFLDFREHFHRTKPQEALYTLVEEADLGGLWIDLLS